MRNDDIAHVVVDAVADEDLHTIAAACRHLPLISGESSGAVTRALGVSQLSVSVEIAPGVPWSFCQGKEQNIALALKSRNFSAVSFFADAMTTSDGMMSNGMVCE